MHFLYCVLSSERMKAEFKSGNASGKKNYFWVEKSFAVRPCNVHIYRETNHKKKNVDGLSVVK